LEVAAYDQTLALNKVAQQISLRKKLRRLVRDAIYGIGICRIGMIQDRNVSIKEIAPELDEEVEGEVGVGRMMLEVISFESWVHDCQADTLEQVEFCGHAYWVDEDELESYLPGAKSKDLVDDEKKFIDEHGGEMAAAISRGTEGGGEQTRNKKYWLWDLWIPRQNAIVTVPVNGTGDIAHVRPWNSRPGGPYLYLAYRELSDQAMPMSIMADLALVHDSENSTLRKLMDQVKNQKTVLGYKQGHEDDAKRVIEAGSRAAIAMRDPTATKEFNFNGPDQALLATFMQLRELGSIIGGNTDVLSGLTAQAPTLGQEEMASQNASNRIQSMEMETTVFVTELFEAMRWYLYHEQIESVPIVKEVQGTDLKIPSEWSALKALQTNGRFDSYSMQIEPYSMVYRSPQQRLRAILDLWQGIIMPALQIGMISQVPDMDQLLTIISRYSNLPELKSILRFASPEEKESAGSEAESPRQSPVTTRNYIRRGAPGPSRQGMAMQAMQMMGSSGGGGGRPKTGE
jgi:hypothetical protein